MMVIGITGPTGAGKSIVCRLLGDWERISIVDCDRVARQVVRRGNGACWIWRWSFPPPLWIRTGS